MKVRTVFIVLMGLLVAAGLTGLAIHNARGGQQKSTDVEVIVARVSEHYLLPSSEKPALATVTDTSKLETEFLKQAENGDKLLVYENAHLVIMYRPSIDRIVAVGPVEIAPLISNDKPNNQ